MSNYPEHAKLKAIADKSQAIGEFLSWLEEEKGAALCALCPDEWGGKEWFRFPTSIPNLLAEYFEIDQTRLEDEKQQMLDEMRAQFEAAE